VLASLTKETPNIKLALSDRLGKDSLVMTAGVRFAGLRYSMAKMATAKLAAAKMSAMMALMCSMAIVSRP